MESEGKQLRDFGRGLEHQPYRGPPKAHKHQDPRFAVQGPLKGTLRETLGGGELAFLALGFKVWGKLRSPIGEL